MKTIIEFNHPEDSDLYSIHQDAIKNYNSLWDIKEYIRNKIKYEELDCDTFHHLQEIQKLIPDLEVWY